MSTGTAALTNGSQMGPGAGPSKVLSGHKRSIKTILLSRDGLIVYSAASDKEVRAWSTTDGTCLGIGSGHTGIVVCLTLSREGDRLFSGSEDNNVREWVTTGIITAGKVRFPRALKESHPDFLGIPAARAQGS